jgi:transposase InsO family protein
MEQRDPGLIRDAQRWAHFRFSVVGPLLAAPPKKGELKEAIASLANKAWKHPITGEESQFSFASIERWYYDAKNERIDPVGVLEKKTRKDKNRLRAITAEMAALLEAQYREHRRWSYKLHADNLVAVIDARPELGTKPSYPSVRRFMKQRGFLKVKKRRKLEKETAHRFTEREVRSYEAEHVHGLWHADFHQSSLKIVTRSGGHATPVALAFIDDRSRLCCHAQWYLGETAEHFVHGLSQAIQKRRLPRALLTDNGAPMLAKETVQGLARLGVVHQRTLPYSPYQNGKQEVFWARLEGRLMAMLEGTSELDLEILNRATQAWVEMEYNKEPHTETKQPPYERFLAGPDVGRDSPTSDALRLAFCQEVVRGQRRSDGTITVEGVRYEVPNRYRMLETVQVRFASWDKRFVHLVDPNSGEVLCLLQPLDRAANADGRRRTIEAPADEAIATPSGMAPLLEKLMRQYEQHGLGWGYLPKSESESEEN